VNAVTAATLTSTKRRVGTVSILREPTGSVHVERCEGDRIRPCGAEW
jgi:hypothetical protein